MATAQGMVLGTTLEFMSVRSLFMFNYTGNTAVRDTIQKIGN